jgi:hypothetical protein
LQLQFNWLYMDTASHGDDYVAEYMDDVTATVHTYRLA